MDVCGCVHSLETTGSEEMISTYSLDLFSYSFIIPSPLFPLPVCFLSLAILRSFIILTPQTEWCSQTLYRFIVLFCNIFNGALTLFFLSSSDSKKGCPITERISEYIFIIFPGKNKNNSCGKIYEITHLDYLKKAQYFSCKAI